MARPTRAAKAASTTPTLPRGLVSGVQTRTPASALRAGAGLTDQALPILNLPIERVRQAGSTYEALRLLRRLSGDVSTSVGAFVRLAGTALNWRVYSPDHTLSPDGSTLLRTVLMRLQLLNDYSYGYDDRLPLQSLVDTLLNELLLCGGVGLELVLDQARLPFKLQPVSALQLKWKVEDGPLGQKIVPYQQVGSKTISLDIPTFFYAHLDHDPTTVYSKSPIESSVNAAIFSSETLEDIRRVVRRSGHSRLLVTLLLEEVVKAAPIDIKADPAKLGQWAEQKRLEIVNELEALSPEAALVIFDNIKADYLNSEIGASADYGPLTDIVDGVVATSLRTPPSVLGKRMGGSQNTSSAESLLFVKHAEGLQPPLETLLGRALTLALRLVGFQGYVVAEFDNINLRPEDELEAFKSMKQARILELLSLGFLEDQEAAEILRTGERAEGAPKLSGSFFYKADASLQPTGMDVASSLNGDPGQRAVTGNLGEAPRQAGGVAK